MFITFNWHHEQRERQTNIKLIVNGLGEFRPPPEIYGKCANQNTGPTCATDCSPLRSFLMHLILKFHRFGRPLLLSPHFRIVPKRHHCLTPTSTLNLPQPQLSPWPAQDAFGGVDVARILKDKQRAGPRFLSPSWEDFGHSCHRKAGQHHVHHAL